MPRIKLRKGQRFSYKGTLFTLGDPVECSEEDAAYLLGLKETEKLGDSGNVHEDAYFEAIEAVEAAEKSESGTSEDPLSEDPLSEAAPARRKK